MLASFVQLCVPCGHVVLKLVRQSVAKYIDILILHIDITSLKLYVNMPCYCDQRRPRIAPNTDDITTTSLLQSTALWMDGRPSCMDIIDTDSDRPGDNTALFIIHNRIFLRADVFPISCSPSLKLLLTGQHECSALGMCVAEHVCK